jgi:hypothetical protein
MSYLIAKPLKLILSTAQALTALSAFVSAYTFLQLDDSIRWGNILFPGSIIAMILSMIYHKHFAAFLLATFWEVGLLTASAVLLGLSSPQHHGPNGPFPLASIKSLLIIHLLCLLFSFGLKLAFVATNDEARLQEIPSCSLYGVEGSPSNSRDYTNDFQRLNAPPRESLDGAMDDSTPYSASPSWLLSAVPPFRILMLLLSFLASLGVIFGWLYAVGLGNLAAESRSEPYRDTYHEAGMADIALGSVWTVFGLTSLIVNFRSTSARRLRVFAFWGLVVVLSCFINIIYFVKLAKNQAFVEYLMQNPGSSRGRFGIELSATAGFLFALWAVLAFAVSTAAEAFSRTRPCCFCTSSS